MRIYLTGISCVGKTTIGAKLSQLLEYTFFDLDKEIEKYFKTSIERLQNKYLSMHSFREEASKALVYILSLPESKNSVIALPPSGLMGGYWRVIKKHPGKIIVLQDTPENILKRTTFYDIDSRLIKKNLSEKDKKYYLRDIKKDMTYFGRSYSKAGMKIDISSLNPDEAAQRLKEIITNANK